MEYRYASSLARREPPSKAQDADRVTEIVAHRHEDPQRVGLAALSPVRIERLSFGERGRFEPGGPGNPEADRIEARRSLDVLFADDVPLLLVSGATTRECPADHLIIDHSPTQARAPDHGCAADPAAGASAWRLRIPKAELFSRLPQAQRLIGVALPCTDGAGFVLKHVLAATLGWHRGLDGETQYHLSQQILQLLGFVLQRADCSLRTDRSTVRNAHLRRIENYILENLSLPDLNADRIAGACGISKRYVHELFSDTGTSVAAWIRDQRLTRARIQLADRRETRPIATLAYDLGFHSQAQFSRTFKARFKITPRAYRNSIRALDERDAESASATRYNPAASIQTLQEEHPHGGRLRI